MELRSRATPLNLGNFVDMSVTNGLLDSLAEGNRHLSLVDFLIEPLLLLSKIGIKLSLACRHRGLEWLLLLDGLQAISNHFPELVPQLEVYLATLAILRDIVLTADIRILHTCLGELIIDSLRVIAPILILTFQTGNQIHLITLHIWSILADVLPFDFWFLNKVHQQ